MIQLRLLLLGITVIGSIGLAVYHHYKSQEQQQHQYSHGRRRRRSFNADDFGPAPPPSGSDEPRKRRLKSSKPTCSICLMVVETEGQYLDCGHGFHEHCIKVWFNMEKTCPNCRAKAI